MKIEIVKKATNQRAGRKGCCPYYVDCPPDGPKQ